MKICHKCKTEWIGLGQPSSKETCNKCSIDLHACRNCKLYDVSKPNQCQANVDPVIDKERYNYCEEFEFIDRKPEKSKSETEQARQKWDKLFEIK